MFYKFLIYLSWKGIHIYIFNGGNSQQKWRVGCESANKKSSANKLAQSCDSGKSQTLKTAPQPTRHFCPEFLPMGYVFTFTGALKGSDPDRADLAH